MRLFLFLLIFSHAGFSQKENCQWFFGARVGLNYCNGAPTPITTHTLFGSDIGSAGVSDSQGNLLFYTNGKEIYNKHHQLMTPVNYLPGAQNIEPVIVKKNANEYYVFSALNFLAYAVVDMSLNNGSGSVTVQGYTVHPTMIQWKLGATHHCNGRDTWIVVRDAGSTVFMSFLVQQGNILPPVISSVSPTSTNAVVGYQNTGFRFSSDGRRFAATDRLTAPLELYDFNPATGIVSNQLLLTNSAFSQGFYLSAEFSPDGSRLYSSFRKSPGPANGSIIQWDLCAGSLQAISASATVLRTRDSNYWAMRNAPDGSMLIAVQSSTVIDRVLFPDNPASTCGYTTMVLQSGISTDGMPSFIADAYRPAPAVSFSATCGMMHFSVKHPGSCNMQTITNCYWEFGEKASVTNTASGLSASHHYAANGTYTVTMIASYNCKSDTVRQVVNVSGLPALSVSSKTAYCKGDVATFTLSGAASYSINGISCSSLAAVSPTQSSTYTITATDPDKVCPAVLVKSLNIKTCLGLEHAEASGRWRVYPQPASTEISMPVEEGVSTLSADIYSPQGEHIAHLQFTAQNGRATASLPQLASGIYYLFFEGAHPVPLLIER